MAKTTYKTQSRKRTSKKKSGFILAKIFFVIVAISSLSFSVYYYREALLLYFSFKTTKVYKEDKIAKARIFQVLNNHKNKVVGVDVSQYQGEINWGEIHSIEGFKIDFVFIRATAGSDKLDSHFNENWSNAKKYKFIRGAYHYYRPNENSIEQANNFIKNVQLCKGDFPPVLDIEQLPQSQSKDSLKAGLKRWLQTVNKHYKVKPIIYSGQKYYEDFLKDEFSDYSFWIANYNFWVDDLNDDWQFWQFTEKGRIKGINENIDVNIYNGSLKKMKNLTITK